MLDFEEAVSRLLGGAPALTSERIALSAAHGRVLAEDVVSAVPLPGFDHSSMDGYAVCSEDFRAAGPCTLPLRGESRAGAAPPPLARGTAVRILTGARMPVGADAVVMQEDTERMGDQITFAKKPSPGAYVRRRGTDLAEGAVAVARGTRLHAAHLGLLGALDHVWPVVARSPLVTIVATGDELRAPGTSRTADTIAESNTLLLASMATARGASVRLAPSVPDDQSRVESSLRSALSGTDVLVTIGGVSVGDHDLVRPALEAIGVTLDFWKVAIRPGKPLAVGRMGNTVVLGLPGNPVSAAITFALFGVPLLAAMQGDRHPRPVARTARLTAPYEHSPGRMEWARARFDQTGTELVATPIANQASGAVAALAQADGVFVVDSSATRLEAGSTVRAFSWRDLGL